MKNSIALFSVCLLLVFSGLAEAGGCRAVGQIGFSTGGYEVQQSFAPVQQFQQSYSVQQFAAPQYVPVQQFQQFAPVYQVQRQVQFAPVYQQPVFQQRQFFTGGYGVQASFGLRQRAFVRSSRFFAPGIGGQTVIQDRRFGPFGLFGRSRTIIRN